LIVAGIPAYNEEKTIAKVILLAQRFVDVVIVCDDGSQDMTADIAEKLGAVVIKHDKNMGYGVALQSLFKKAVALKADILLTLDADGQHDAREMPKLIQPLVESKADIVIGSRFLEENNSIPSYRRLGIKLLTKLTNSGENSHISDAQCGLRAYNRRALESISMYEPGMGASAEILLKAGDQGLKIAEVPVHVQYKDLETSTHHPLGHGLSVISSIIKLVIEGSPLVYLGIPGVVLLSIGILFGIWTLQLYTIEHRIVTNVALVTIAFGLAGVFALFTAITLYAIARLAKRVSNQ
jgi:glycosyltransferase involved in cell wall biosynthesis